MFNSIEPDILLETTRTLPTPFNLPSLLILLLFLFWLEGENLKECPVLMINAQRKGRFLK
jgi:hypothetical protein